MMKNSRQTWNSRVGTFVILFGVFVPLGALGQSPGDVLVLDGSFNPTPSTANVNPSTSKLTVAGDAQTGGDLTVNGTGTSAMAGGVVVNKEGTFNADKGANNFVVYRNNAETDNSAQEVLFLINVAPEEEEEEAENSIEMWGTVEPYWTIKAYAGAPRGSGAYGKRGAAHFYPVPLERFEAIQAHNLTEAGVSDHIPQREEVSPGVWDLNDAASFFGNVRLHQAPLFLHEYGDGNIIQFSRDDFKRVLAEGFWDPDDSLHPFLIDPRTGEPFPMLLNPLTGEPVSETCYDPEAMCPVGKAIPEQVGDRRLIGSLWYTTSLQTGLPGDSTGFAAMINVMADGDHVGGKKPLEMTETEFRASLSAPGQILLATTPEGSYQLPRARLTIKRDGRVGLGYQVMYKPEGEIGIQYYGLADPVDRLHVHANDPRNELEGLDNSFAYDAETFDASSAVRFTNDDTGLTASDGMRVGLDSDAIGVVWVYEEKPLLFATNNVERMRITDDGDVTLSGNIEMASGKTVDGVDVSDLARKVRRLEKAVKKERKQIKRFRKQTQSKDDWRGFAIQSLVDRTGCGLALI